LIYDLFSEVFKLKLKKTVIMTGIVIVALVLAGVGVIIYTISNQNPILGPIRQAETGVADRTNNNINVMLTRPDNWRKIAGSPVISQEEMGIIDGSTATIPVTAELFRQFYDFNDEQVQQSDVVYHSTTHSAYINLIDREYRQSLDYRISIIFVTPPSDEELKYAESQNIELELTPVAKDGFVFITHKDNPIDSLTAEQIQGIYTGEITNWKQVGGNDLEIKAYQREPNSGSQTAMEQMVMQGKKMLYPDTVRVIALWGMGSLIDAVAEYENGPASIGYTYYYYINNLYKNENIKVIKVDGISPSNDNLISGAYPFSTSYYAVIRGDEPEDSPARKLRDYIVTPEGQAIIEMAGYCKAAN